MEALLKSLRKAMNQQNRLSEASRAIKQQMRQQKRGQS